MVTDARVETAASDNAEGNVPHSIPIQSNATDTGEIASGILNSIHKNIDTRETTDDCVVQLHSDQVSVIRDFALHDSDRKGDVEHVGAGDEAQENDLEATPFEFQSNDSYGVELESMKYNTYENVLEYI